MERVLIFAPGFSFYHTTAMKNNVVVIGSYNTDLTIKAGGSRFRVRRSSGESFRKAGAAKGPIRPLPLCAPERLGELCRTRGQ